MKKILVPAMIAASLSGLAPALADPPHWAPAHGHRAKHGDHKPAYRYTDNGIRYWRGEDGRERCRKPDGTTGLLIGGAVGALVGRAIDTRGDRATGTILGAAGGALAGRAIERNNARCR
jgi:hypothetical protein